MFEVRAQAISKLVQRARHGRLLVGGAAQGVWIDGLQEVELRREVAVDRWDRYARLARNRGNGERCDAADHDPPSGIQDSRPGLLSLLRSQLAAICASFDIRYTSHIVNI